MNTKFIINDYILIWSLLFQGSVKESIYKVKQKLWLSHKDDYNLVYKDKNSILEDPRNFIPNNDTIYNYIKDDSSYEEIKKETEKYRRNVMRIWDTNHKEIKYLIENIIRKDIPEYNVLLVHEDLNMVDVSGTNDDIKSLILGKKINNEQQDKILYDILYPILNKEIKNSTLNTEDIRKAIIELAIFNEFATRINKRSCYITGTPELNSLKRQIYPYWLMYLGVAKEDFLKYMMRDNIAFEIENYTYERQFIKMNIEEFIDFVTRNKKIMLKEQTKEIKEVKKQQVEVL